MEMWWECWCNGTGMGYSSLGKDRVDKETWSEMMLQKCDLKRLEMGAVVGVMGLAKK